MPLFRFFAPPASQQWRLYSALIMYGLILIFGIIPGARHTVGEFASGLVLHATVYASLAFLLYTGIDGSSLRRSIIAFSGVAAMGAVDEGVQSFLSYRVGSIQDWLLDMAAATLLLIVLRIIEKKLYGESRFPHP